MSVITGPKASAEPLLSREADGRAFRLIGIGAHDLIEADRVVQADLFGRVAPSEDGVDKALDAVRERFGEDAIDKGHDAASTVVGRLVDQGALRMKCRCPRRAAPRRRLPGFPAQRGGGVNVRDRGPWARGRVPGPMTAACTGGTDAHI